MIARFHAQAIQAMTGGTLHSVYSRREEVAKELSGEFSVRGYSCLDEFLADPELDAVTIATPSGTHCELTEAAAKAGKHIICEKPLDVTVVRAKRMIDCAEENGVTLAAILNRRFQPAIQALKKAVDGQRFGRLTMCDAYVKWFRTQDYYDSGQWRGTWDLDGGGALMNQSIHTIDQLLYVAGPVKAVSASMDCLIHDRIEVEDTAVAILEFESGARGVIQGSTACWSSTGHPAEVHICGEKGSAFLADESFRIWDFEEAAEEDESIRSTLMEGSAQGLGANDPNAINFLGHQRNFEEFVSAIEEGRRPSVDGHEALKAVELICAIYESARNDSKRIIL